MTLLRITCAAIMTVVVELTAFAQGPIHKRVDYTINAPFKMRMGGYVLPAGKYVLRQVTANDLNLFALYRQNLMDEPIAMIRTTRIYFHGSETPGKTRIVLDFEETPGREYPVIRGWTIAGMDGWEIIAVVDRSGGFLSRA